MVGSIYCAKCEKVIQSPCGCKFGKVYIRLNWNNIMTEQELKEQVAKKTAECRR